MAMHQDYCEDYVGDRIDLAPSEEKAGELIVKNLLSANRGHYGVLENPAITLAVGYFPHSVMQQARTHRIGVTFDCQSMRYTGKRLAEAFEKETDIEDLFYLRPPGFYLNRQGKKFEYTPNDRAEDLSIMKQTLEHYAHRYHQGMPEEQARGFISFDFRQHFVVGFNARSLMHFLDLRAKKDAQLEIQWLCELMLPLFYSWMPAVATWYHENRWQKARLAP